VVLNPKSISGLLKGIRIVNLFLVLFFYIIVYLKIIPHVDFQTFALLLVSTLLIMAGGNLENDLFDLQTDRFNRKTNFYLETGTGSARLLPYFFYATGLVIAYLFLHQINRNGWIFYFASVVILLTNYNRSLKQAPFIGNIVVAALSMLSVVQFLFFFDILPYYAEIIGMLGMLIFCVNLNRELVKDLLDRKGDRRSGYHTLGIIHPGIAFQIVFFLSILATAISLFIVFSVDNLYFTILFFMVTLLQLFGILYLFRRKKSLSLLKNLYKWIIFIGITSVMLL